MSHEESAADDVISKSQLKREVEALQKLGIELVKLSAKDLAKIPMPETLSDAVHHGRSINSNAALRRQMQFIGKLMRHIDAEPIQQALDAVRLTGTQSATKFHQLERWRDRIIGEGQSALDEYMALHPQAERQKLRQLMANARKEAEKNKPAKSARSLFRLLRETAETAGIND